MVVGSAIDMMRAGFQRADGGDPGLPEAGDRRAQRHRGRRRRDARARGRPRDRGRHRASSSTCSCDAASIPDGGVAYLLPRIVGMHKAKELVFFGDDLVAPPTPRELGIVNKVVPAAELAGARPRSGPSASRAARPRRSAGRRSCCTTRPRARAPRRARGRGDARRAQQPHRRTARKAWPSFTRSAAPRVEGLVAAPWCRARQGQDRGRRHRADRVRQGPRPTPSCRSRARPIALALDDAGLAAVGGRRARVVHDGGRPRGRRRPQRRARRHHLLLAGRLRRRRRAAASSARPRWRSRPASARSRSRGGPASAPPRRAGRGRRSPTGSPDTSSGAGRSGMLRPVDEIAMLTRRYMHEYGDTRDHLANVALAFRKHASAQPERDDGPQAADARGVHGRALDLRAAVPVRQLPRDRRRARGRDHVGRAGARPAAAAGVHPRVRAGHPAAAPDDDQLLQRRPAARSGVGRARGCCGRSADVEPGRRAGRAALRRVQPADPAVARGLRLLRARRGRRRSPTTARSSGPTAGCPTNTSGGGMSEAYVHGFNLVLEGVRQIRGTSHEPGRRTPTCSLVTSGEGVPTSRDPLHERTVTRCETGLPAPRPRRADLGRRSGRARARGELLVQACGVVRRVAHAAAADVPACAGRSTCTWEPTSGRGHDLVVHRPAPAAAARVLGARAVQRDRRRARRGPDDPLRRQPRRRAPTARSTRSTRRRSRSANRSRSCSPQVDDVFLPRWVGRDLEPRATARQRGARRPRRSPDRAAPSTGGRIGRRDLGRMQTPSLRRSTGGVDRSDGVDAVGPIGPTVELCGLSRLLLALVGLLVPQ